MIQPNIKTNGVEITEEFGLIERWKIIKEDNNGKAIAIEVKLSDWFYNSILGDAVLTIDKDYFRLRKPTERRLYELARKHCGNQMAWKISLQNLKDKLGVTSQMKLFRFNIKAIAESNHLPEYNISLEDDVILFSRKEPPKENQAPQPLPKHVTDGQVNEFVRQNPNMTKGKSMAEVKDLITKPKRTNDQITTRKVALSEAKKKLR